MAMPQLPPSRVAEFRAALDPEIKGLVSVYQRAAADMLDVLSKAASTVAQRERAMALLRQYQVILGNLHDQTAAWLAMNMPRGYDLAMEFADEGLAKFRQAGINIRRPPSGGIAGRGRRDVFAQVHQQAVAAATDAFLNSTNAAFEQIGRRVDDLFRRESLQAVVKGIAEGKTRRAVSAEIKQSLLDKGAPYFEDKLGRRWPLDRYTEMVARTTTREAMTQGTVNRLNEHGIELAQVSVTGTPDLCIYYERTIVYIGAAPNPTAYPPISAIGGGPPFHPNCQHTLQPFVIDLATEKEKAAGKIAPDLLDKSPAELQKRFRQEFPGQTRTASLAGGEARSAKGPVLDAVRKELDALTRGLPPKHLRGVRIQPVAGPGTMSRIPGTKYQGTALGDYRAGRIRVYEADQPRPTVKGYTHSYDAAHEVGHHVWNKAELRTITGRGGAADAMSDFSAAWRERDGITNYSRAWTKAGKESETFAELYALRATSDPRYPRTPKSLRDAFERVWEAMA